jgi:hypothetical protein
LSYSLDNTDLLYSIFSSIPITLDNVNEKIEYEYLSFPSQLSRHLNLIGKTTAIYIYMLELTDIHVKIYKPTRLSIIDIKYASSL